MFSIDSMKKFEGISDEGLVKITDSSLSIVLVNFLSASVESVRI